jgi:CcmD family protein
MRSLVLKIFSLGILCGFAAPMAAQDAAQPQPTPAAAEAPAYGASPAAAEPGASAAAQPVFAAQTSGASRTLRAHWHVYLAFGATWLLLFGYALSIGQRAKKLEQEINMLRS